MKNKSYIFLVFSIIFLISSIIVNFLIPTKESVKEKLNDFLTIKEENKQSYIYPDSIAFSSDELLFIYKKDTIYVVKAKESVIKEIKDLDLSTKRYKLVGYSKRMDDITKENIVKTNNTEYSYSEESQITESDVIDTYGEYYLLVDYIEDDIKIGSNYRLIKELLLELSIVLIVVFIISFQVEKSKRGII